MAFTFSPSYSPSTTTPRQVSETQYTVVANREAFRMKNGMCPSCGVQISCRVWWCFPFVTEFEPLTIRNQVDNGRCLKCNSDSERSVEPEDDFPFQPTNEERFGSSRNYGTNRLEVPAPPSRVSPRICLFPCARRVRYDEGFYEGESSRLSRKPSGHGKWIGDNGDFYEGEWRNGIREGRGKCRYANGNEFEGNWKNGLMEGEGIYRKSKNKYVYVGGWKSGMMDGYGAMYYGNETNVYMGEWRNGQQDGFGIFSGASGDTYEGEWFRSKKQGQGTYTVVEGVEGWVYEGEWKDDVRDGYGKGIWPNGDTYKGGWKNNMREGYAIAFYAETGDTYKGEWYRDKKQGRGTRAYAEGWVYEGKWKDDVMDGKGKGRWPNGDTYKGGWKNNLREGDAIVFCAETGDTYKTKWKENKLCESVSCITESQRGEEKDSENGGPTLAEE